jgi:ketosteroid isomerase-like protein
MSENLDLVRSIFAGWERGDFFSSGGWVHPEIEYVIADGPEPGRWTGLLEMVKGHRNFLSAWEDYRVDVDEYRELDDERILVLLHHRGRGKTSGLEVDQMRSDGANLAHIRDEKVIKLVVYWERKNALADLGLVE